MIRILVAALLALAAASQASRADTFAIDLVLGAPAADGFVQIAVGPREILYIPASAFPKSGRLSFDDKFEHNRHEGEAIPGALSKDKLKKKIAGLFDDVNRAYAPAGVSFRVRSITFIDPAKVGLGPRVNKDGPFLNLGISKDKDGKEKSDLLARFRTFTGKDRSAFKMLMVPIADEAAAGHQGRADNPGIHSVVDLGNAFRKLDNGFAAAHELGHNLGLDHVTGSPFRHFMAGSVPNREGGPNVTTPCENLIGGEGCKRIGTVINNYRSQRWVEKRSRTRGGGDGGQTEESGGNEGD